MKNNMEHKELLQFKYYVGKDLYLINVFEEENWLSFWLTKSGCGHSESMFGISTEDQTNSKGEIVKGTKLTDIKEIEELIYNSETLKSIELYNDTLDCLESKFVECYD